MSDVMLCGILRIPFDHGNDLHLMQLQQACREAANELEHREAEIARLREVLSPFASFADLIDGDPAASPTGDLCPLTLDYDRINDGRIASLGDCRRARAALEQKG